MNKKKTLLLVLLSMVTALTLAFAVGCSDKHDDELLKGNYQGEEDVIEPAADDWVLQYITLNTENVTKTYEYGTEFNASEKPVVTARFVTVESLAESIANKDTENPTPLVTKDEDVTASAVLDYSQYNANAVGKYTIYVNYTHANISRSANYEVSVIGVEPANGGILITKTTTSYTIQAGNKTVNVNLDDIAVKNVSLDDNGDEVVEDIDEDDYTLTFFKDGVTEVTAEEMATAGKGAYTIIATSGNSSSQLVVNVLNPLVSIAMKESSEEGVNVLTQQQSVEDLISDTWIFVVTYVNGDTVEIKKGDAGLAMGNIDPIAVASGSVKVIYTEDDETKDTTVNYTITAKDGCDTVENAYAFSAITGVSNDTILKASDMTGVNSFITPEGKLRYRGGSNSFVDFNAGAAFSVTFLGFGKLELTVRSTGSSNVSGLYVLDEEGNYLTALFEDGIGFTEIIDDDTVTYAVADAISTSYKKITFIISEPGTYTVYGAATAGIINQAYTRVNTISMLDVCDSNIDRISYEFSINTEDVKTDYIAGETLDTTGIVATLKEVHSANSDLDDETDVSADITASVTSGNLNDFGKTATVTVKYVDDNGNEFTATYTINVASPVTGVNSVALVKEAEIYNIESAEEDATVTIESSDITLKANSATGNEITLGEGESVNYKLYSGNTELSSWAVSEGTYKIVATIVLNNTAEGKTGTTTFTAEITVTVKPYVAPGASISGTTTYLSTAGDEGEVYTLESSDDTNQVATLAWVGGSTKESGSSSKTVNGVAYSTYINVNGGGRYITLKLSDKIISAKITVICGTGTAGRSIGLFKGTVKAAADSTLDKALNSVTASETSSGYSFTANVNEGGDYTVTAVTNGSDTAAVRIYAIIIEYELDASEDAEATNLLSYDMYVEEK